MIGAFAASLPSRFQLMFVPPSHVSWPRLPVPPFVVAGNAKAPQTSHGRTAQRHVGQLRKLQQPSHHLLREGRSVGVRNNAPLVCRPIAIHPKGEGPDLRNTGGTTNELGVVTSKAGKRKVATGYLTPVAPPGGPPSASPPTRSRHSPRERRRPDNTGGTQHVTGIDITHLRMVKFSFASP